MNLTLAQLKITLREYAMCDQWGFAMEAYFECCGRIYSNGGTIYSYHGYSPGLTPCDRESMFYDDFKTAKNMDLIRMLNFLYRYTRYLKYKGCSY